MLTVVLVVLGLLAVAGGLLIAMFVAATRRSGDQRHRNAINLARSAKDQEPKNRRR